MISPDRPRVPGAAPRPGDLLPSALLPSLTGGAVADLRSGRGPRALLTVHSAGCPECRQYVASEFARAFAQVGEWGGRLAVIVPGNPGEAPELAEIVPAGIELLRDPEAGLASGRAQVVIADEWGEVFFVEDAGAAHDLPGSLDIRDWIRFLAIQCPECEGPEGAWRTI